MSEIDNPNLTFTTSILEVMTDDFGEPEAVELTLTFDIDQLRKHGVGALYDPVFDIISDLKKELHDLGCDFDQ